MFYHVLIMVTGIDYGFDFNLTSEEVLSKYLCPFLNNEKTLMDGKISNLSSYGSMQVFETDRPVDSDYPVKRVATKGKESQDLLEDYNWKDKVREVLQKRDVTTSFYQKAVILLYSGKYKELRFKLILDALGKYSFFICPFGNNEIDHNYEYVIKPLVRQFQFKIERADEISHTKTITEVILEAIMRSAFIIADLTDAHPNCYYEVGYAHSLGKPIIILAKNGTMRHFDLSTYKWNYWIDYKDLKLKFEKELVTLLTSLGIKTEQ